MSHTDDDLLRAAAEPTGDSDSVGVGVGGSSATLRFVETNRMYATADPRVPERDSRAAGTPSERPGLLIALIRPEEPGPFGAPDSCRIRL